MSLSLDIGGARELEAYLGSVTEGLDDLTELHEQFIIIIQSHIQKNWPTGPGLSKLTIGARARGGSKPLFASGKLWRSATGQSSDGSVEANGKWARLEVSHPGATTHQFGAIIRPKRAKFLAVPMSPEATKAGSPRNFGKELTLLPLKRKPGYIAVERLKRKGRKIGGGRELGKAHFLFTKETRIPARPFFPEVEDVADDIDDATSRFVASLTGEKT